MITLAIKNFIEAFNNQKDEYFEFICPDTKAKFTFDLGNKPASLSCLILLDDGEASNKTNLIELLGIPDEDLNFDDYDEIDYNASTVTESPDEEGKIPVIYNITYNLIR